MKKDTDTDTDKWIEIRSKNLAYIKQPTSCSTFWGKLKRQAYILDLLLGLFKICPFFSEEIWDISVEVKKLAYSVFLLVYCNYLHNAILCLLLCHMSNDSCFQIDLRRK